MGKKGFRDLIVWQRSKDLAVLIYQDYKHWAYEQGLFSQRSDQKDGYKRRQ